MKRTDLAKNAGLKVQARMKAAGVPGRYAQGGPDTADRREQRRRDAEAGLVPFACKLPAELAATLRVRAQGHDGGLNALVSDLIARGLDTVD